jgi:hypothetical protein
MKTKGGLYVNFIIIRNCYVDLYANLHGDIANSKYLSDTATVGYIIHCDDRKSINQKETKGEEVVIIIWIAVGTFTVYKIGEWIGKKM